ncbi:MAG: hypothetical protein K8W52_15810 [Deltaproteobacteria bacterium]|nr:hypothetical protein [Deltaproteobacteria bacterium]
MIEDKIATLERTWNFVAKHEGVEFMLEVPGFMDFLRSEPLYSDCLREFEREEAESIATVLEEERSVLRALKAIYERLRTGFPAALPGASDDPDDPETTEGIEEALSADPEALHPGTWPDGRRTGRLLLTIKPLVQDIDALAAELAPVRDRYEFAARRRALDARVGVGAALVKISRWVEDVFPSAHKRDSDGRLAEEAFLSVARAQRGARKAVVDHLRGESPKFDDTFGEGRAEFDEYKASAERVYIELRNRIGTTRSLISMIHRFRQRSEWYDAHELRQFVESARRNGPGSESTATAGSPAEDLLTDRLARFLFDAGVHVVTRTVVGAGLKPDVVTLGHHLYVEAKRIESNDKSYLRRGTNQIWGTVRDLIGEPYAVREICYLIFQTDGPTYTFPEMVKEPNSGLRMFPIVVDLRPMGQRGSRSKTKTVAITEADLLPTDDE